MWHPPESIRHKIPAARWPTEEEAASALLFQPIRVGPVRLESRTWVPAMVPWRATEDGFVTKDNLDWYARFAEGRPGAIVVEATGVRDVPSGPLLRIGHDRFLPGLRSLVEAVERASEGHTRLFIQILDFLAVKRRPEASKYFERFLAVGDRHRRALARETGEERWLEAPEAEVRAFLAAAPEALQERTLDPRESEAVRCRYRGRAPAPPPPHVRELPRTLPGIFAEAAARGREAGFDGVELHYAHAYTMASFLSRTNTRDDGYGGSRENRLRLPLEVSGAVRARVGSDYDVGVRFLGDEAVAGGCDPVDAVHFGLAVAREGFDFLSLSKGGKFDDAKQPPVGWAVYPYTGRSGYECMPTVLSDARGPFGRNVPLAAAVRRSVVAAGLSAPVVVSGGIGTFEQAEGILRAGEADIVAAARQSLADPDWFRKVRLGRGDSVRRCVYTNYCEGLDQKHRKVTCKLWDRVALDEPGIPLADEGRRRLLPPRWRP